uniref:HTH OST-type domain-containing protein n=1 Tax=Megaselia scalaris TaxID=36166 RepID=T1GLK9_MEGSC
MAELSGIKMVIKSIVLSCNDNSLNVEKLGRLYKNSEGENIPYKKYGYYSLENFIRSLSDAVLVIGYGPAALVKPVSSEKTKHLEEMISKQKKPALKK